MAALASAGAGIPLAAQGRVNEGRAVAADASIRIINPAGSVRVVGWDHDSLAVSGTVGETAGKFFLGGTDRSLKLGIDWPQEKKELSSSDFEVRVPQGSRVWVKTITAEIDVDGITGSIDVVTVSGRIRVAGQPADVNAESLDGGIEIAAESPSVRAKTASGPLVLRGLLRESEVSSVSGPLLVGMTGPVRRVRLSTLSGEIAFKGDLEPGGSLEAETHSGNVELRLPTTLGADFDINSYGGEIRNELTKRGTVPSPGKNGEWHFTLGNGSARVMVRTFKGMVVLKPR
jgi:hypothetical protein